MSNYSKNEAKSHSGPAHRYPAFNPNTSSDGGTDQSEGTFRPLFKRHSNEYSPFSPSGAEVEDIIDQAKKDEVCRLSFEKGLQDGKQDACRLSKESTEPGLIDFLQAVENVSAFHSHVVETASNQIVQMAIKICERVLSSPIKLSKRLSDALGDEIQRNLSQNHQLALCLEKKDLQAIRELTACFHLVWPDSSAVTIESESQIRRGQIVAKPQTSDATGLGGPLETRLKDILSNSQDTELYNTSQNTL